MANFGKLFDKSQNYGYSQESERPVSNLFDIRQDNRDPSSFERNQRGYDSQPYGNKSYSGDRDSHHGWNNQTRGRSRYQNVRHSRSNYQSGNGFRDNSEPKTFGNNSYQGNSAQGLNYETRNIGFQIERKTYGNNKYQNVFDSKPGFNTPLFGGNDMKTYGNNPYQNMFDKIPELNTPTFGGNMSIPENPSVNLFDMPTDIEKEQEPNLYFRRQELSNFQNRYEGSDRTRNYKERGNNQQNNFRRSWNTRGRSRGIQRRQQTNQFGIRNERNIEGKDANVDLAPSGDGEGDNDGGVNYEGHSDDEEEDSYEKVNTFIPGPDLVEKYKYYPPNSQELGKMFEGLVICFSFKVKNVTEKNPFVTICESFRSSDRFDPLEIEDGYLQGNKYVKFCTIRYHGLMMVRGVGETGNVKEPRVRAAVDLINELARTCYTLKMKIDYFSNGAFQKILDAKESPGVFKVVPKEETPTLDSAKEYIDNFFKEDTDCELILCDYVFQLKGYARKKGLNCRTPKLSYLAICKKRTPQYWRDKFLASGITEDEKYELYRPTGESKVLIEDFDIQDCIPALKKFPSVDTESFDRTQLYGKKNAGPNIAKVFLPWDKNRKGRGGFRGRGGRHFKPNKTMSKINEALSQGKQLNKVKEFRFLSKSRKTKLKKKLKTKLKKKLKNSS